jgi:hypothetical protein
MYIRVCVSGEREKEREKERKREREREDLEFAHVLLTKDLRHLSLSFSLSPPQHTHTNKHTRHDSAETIATWQRKTYSKSARVLAQKLKRLAKPRPPGT